MRFSVYVGVIAPPKSRKPIISSHLNITQINLNPRGLAVLRILHVCLSESTRHTTRFKKKLAETEADHIMEPPIAPQFNFVSFLHYFFRSYQREEQKVHFDDLVNDLARTVLILFC